MKTLALLLLPLACMAQVVPPTSTTTLVAYYVPPTKPDHGHHYATRLPDLSREAMPTVGEVWHLADGTSWEFCCDLLLGRKMKVARVYYYWKSVPTSK